MGRCPSWGARAGLFIPTRTASAFPHRKLAADLMVNRDRAVADAELWGRTVYAPALARRDALAPDERSVIVAQLARYTGLDARSINRDTLIVDRQFLMDNLLNDRGQDALGRFDTREVAGAAPIDQAANQQRRTLVNRYLRHTLGFKTDLVYQGIETGYSPSPETRSVGARWQWDQGPPGVPLVVRNTDAPPGGTPPLAAAHHGAQPQPPGVRRHRSL